MAVTLREASQEAGLQVEFLDPVNSVDVETVGRLLADVFLRLEPMTVQLAQNDPGLTQVMHGFSRLYAAEVAAHGLTAIGRNAAGRIVALVMAEPYDADAPAPPITALDPVFAVLGSLGEAFRAHRQDRADEFCGPLLHLAMAATDPDEPTTPKAGTALLKAIISKAKIQGRLKPREAYTHMVAEATSVGSQMLLRWSFGFREVASEAYANHPAFTSLSHPAEARLMVKALQAAKSYPVPEALRRTRESLSSRFEAALRAAPASPLVDAVRALPPTKHQAFVRAVRDTLAACRKPAPPFGAVYDQGVLRAMRAAADAGMPIFDNGILAPGIPAGNWPYHFKAQELAVVQRTAAGAGLRDPTLVHGYVCDRNEANRFGLRALKATHQAADASCRPVVIASEAAHPSIALGAEGLGLECVPIQVDARGAIDAEALRVALRHGLLADPRRPVILVATLGAENGAFDDISALSNVLAEASRATLIHVDASRSFDFLPRDVSGAVQAFTLQPNGAGEQLLYRPLVHSLAAGGLSTHAPQYVAALCHQQLQLPGKHVAYLRGDDTTLAGSRPAVAGLSAYLLQQRFRPEALASMAARAQEAAHSLQELLAPWGLRVEHTPGSLDVALQGTGVADLPASLLETWGLRRHADCVVLTVQPSARDAQVHGLITALASCLSREVPAGLTQRSVFQTSFTFGQWHIRPQVRQALRQTVQELRSRDTRPSGYPGNHATLDLLAPLLQPFLTLPIPAERANTMATEIIGRRLAALGVAPGDAHYAGMITSGSTVSIHSGLVNALRTYPNEPVQVYISREAHYAGAKICADHLELAHRVRLVDTNARGEMDPVRWVAQLRADRAQEPQARAILLATHGTTFRGAIDDVRALLTAAEQAGQRVDYVHVDGALDLGTSMGPYRLANPGAPPEAAGLSVRVQSLSVSNHKFPGVKVSGVHLAVLPPSSSGLPVVGDEMDRMATLQLWAYDQLIDGPTGELIRRACLRNAQALRSQLRAMGELAEGAPESLITVINRPSNLLTNRFLLAPEGDKCHVIAMPHLRHADMQAFVDALQQSKARTQEVQTALNAALAELGMRGEVADVTLDNATLRQVATLLAGEGPAVLQQERALHNAFANGDALAAMARDASQRVVGVVLTQRVGDGWQVFADLVDRGLTPAWRDFISEELLAAVKGLDIRGDTL